MAKNIERINAFLSGIHEQETRRKSNCQLSVVKYPHSLEGYNLCLWEMIKNGDILQATKFAAMIDFKLNSHVIFDYSPYERTLFEDYRHLIDAVG